MNNSPREGEELHADALASWILRDSTRRLIVLMGLPASGKSKLCERLEKLKAVRVNRDAIRKRLYGDEGTLGDTKVVNGEYFKELRAAFAAGGPVISDNVNITFFHRKGTLNAAREAGYNDITIVWVDVPLEVALERNRNRDRKVPEDAIRSMHADLHKYGGPREDEGNLVVLHNGKDIEHYRIHKIRAASAPAAASPSATPNTSATPPKEVPLNNNPDRAEQRIALVGDLRKQVVLLDACVAAGRDQWAAETLGVVRQLAESGVSLFAVGTTGTTDGAAKPKPPAKKPWIPPTPEEVTETLLKMIGSRPVVTGDGPLVALCFNGHLLTKEKAERLIVPILELVKRAHIIFFQESNVDALRFIARAARYGLNASHRNARDQACGILFHPRLHWLGKAPIYHDYLLDVPNHPEYKATLRPALQRRVRDLATGLVLDCVDLHGKSNLGGPEQTRPVRRWQFEALVAELEKQTVKSPYEAREAAAGSTKQVDNTGYDLPLGAVIIGGDYNAPVEKPETTEVEPILKAGFQLVSTPDKRWTYQYRGNGGQFDGFFVRGLDGMVTECFIPTFFENKRDAAFYREVSDHLPVFMVITPPAKPASADAAVEAPTAPVEPEANATDKPAA